MSKSKKRNISSTQPNQPPPSNRRLWLLWVGLAVVSVLAVVALLAWQGGRNADSDTASGTPNLEVDQTHIDFGDVPMDKMVKASFKLSNTGDAPLNVVVPDTPEVVEGC